MVKDTACIPLSEQRLLHGSAILSDEATLESLGTDASATILVTLVRVKASPPSTLSDNRAVAFNRPLQFQLKSDGKPFFGVFHEPSAQWRDRYMFDRGFRSGAAAAIVVLAPVGVVAGVAGGAAFGLVGGCASVLCRSCAGRRLELHWVTTDFKDAAFTGFCRGSMVPGWVMALTVMPVCASVGALLGLVGDAACASVRCAGSWMDV